MCNAFSCIVLKSRKVIWKLGTDSHDDLLKSAGIADDTKDPKEIKFCRVEISPEDGDYLNSDAKYKFKIDTDIVPVWWEEGHEKAAWLAFQKWKKQLDKILVRKPIIHPFHMNPPSEITEEHIRLLKEWDSVRASVGDSVWASVGASVGAYIGTFFVLPRESWKYTKNIKTEEYPFQCLATLWERGLVPSFDGKKWRLHGGKDAEILYEWTP